MSMTTLYIGLAMIAGSALGTMALLFAQGAFRKDSSAKDEHEELTQ